MGSVHFYVAGGLDSFEIDEGYAIEAHHVRFENTTRRAVAEDTLAYYETLVKDLKRHLRDLGP